MVKMINIIAQNSMITKEMISLLNGLKAIKKQY